RPRGRARPALATRPGRVWDAGRDLHADARGGPAMGDVIGVRPQQARVDGCRPARPRHAGEPGRGGRPQRGAVREERAQHLGAAQPPGGAPGRDLRADCRLGHAFSPDHRNLVTELATQAAVAIDNARLFKDREEVIYQSLVALARAGDAKDRYTAGHADRVTEYALMIARQMQ